MKLHEYIISQLESAPQQFKKIEKEIEGIA